MHLPADRLRKIQELYSESFTFAIDKNLPLTVLGQCIVSYRKFIDSLTSEYGFDIFDVKSPVEVRTAIRSNYRDRNSFGLTVKCASITEAIRITKLALKRSTGDCFTAHAKVNNKLCAYPITEYIAESKKPIFNHNCRVLSFIK